MLAVFGGLVVRETSREASLELWQGDAAARVAQKLTDRGHDHGPKGAVLSSGWSCMDAWSVGRACRRLAEGTGPDKHADLVHRAVARGELAHAPNMRHSVFNHACFRSATSCASPELRGYPNTFHYILRPLRTSSIARHA